MCSSATLDYSRQADIQDLITRFNRLDSERNTEKHVTGLEKKLQKVKGELKALHEQFQSFNIAKKEFAEQIKSECVEQLKSATSKVIQLMEKINHENDERSRDLNTTTTGQRLIDRLKSLLGQTAKFAMWVVSPFLLEIHRNAHNFAKNELHIANIFLSSSEYEPGYRRHYWTSFNYQLQDMGSTEKMFPGFETITSFLPAILPSVGQFTDSVVNFTKCFTLGAMARGELTSSEGVSDYEGSNALTRPFLSKSLLAA